MIVLDSLVRRFGRRTALDGIDLEVPRGSVQGLLGPNGAGKTTLVNILTTLLAPDAGDALVAGRSVRTDPAGVRSLLGASGQYSAVDERLTGYENLHMVARLYGMPRREARTRTRSLLRDFRLDDVADDLPAGQYSGGMRRRLDLAGAVIARPEVVILDEPTTGLDPRGRRDIWDAVVSLTADGTTVLLTTQYLEEADQLADRLAVIDHGQVIAEGTPGQLKAQVGTGALTVRVIEAERREEAAAVLARVLDAEIVRESDPTALSARIGPEIRAASALTALEESGIGVENFALGQPSLDEVFLALTGHRAEDKEPEQDTTGGQGERPSAAAEPVSAATQALSEDGDQR